MKKALLVVFALFLFSPHAKAQSLSSILKKAGRAEKAGQLLLAAELWEHAGRLKNSDPFYLYRAAENYARIRDYRRAGDCYLVALTDERFPLAPLRYARALKQQGRYVEALKFFEKFAEGYVGDSKALMIPVVENEIAGCKLALKLFENQDTILLSLIFPDSIHTSENEFAPIPFSDQLVYFSRSCDQHVKFMRSIHHGTKFGVPEEAISLPEAVSDKFYTGCFTPDGSRFYYTQCSEGCPAESGGSIQSDACSIFCIRRTETGWGAPERLWPYINFIGNTNLFPQVAHSDGLEYLFFSSDRVGGFGGLDLYVCVRPLDAEALDFSFPQNLGNKVNTGADEVTPFFQADAQILWFSSLGHPSIGGLDIFKTEKVDGVWSKPVNAGLPFNSPSDDYFLVLKKSGEGAFMSSNRILTGQAKNTFDDDIFELNWH